MPPEMPNYVDYLSPPVLMGMIETFPRIEDQIGDALFPFQDVEGDTLLYDLITTDAPLASFSAPGAESPKLDLIDQIQQMSIKIAYVRSKIQHNENDVRWLRYFGDRPQNAGPVDPRDPTVGMRRAALQRLTNSTRRLSEAVDRRIEKMRIDTLLGALTVTPTQAENVGKSEITFSISWGVITQTAGNAAGSNSSKLWSDPTSDPLLDINNWYQALRFTPSRAIMSKKMMGYLRRNTTLRSQYLVTGAGGAVTSVAVPQMLSQEQILDWFRREFGVNEIVLYDSVYTTMAETLSSGAPVQTLSEVRYMPDNKVVFTVDGPLGYFATAPAPQNGWNPGKFAFTLDPEETGRKDPWIWETVCGIYGIPVFTRADRTMVVTAAA